jgi:hypothetical protein
MDSPASQAIQLGVPLDEHSSIYFFLCLGAAIFIVLLYAMKKFEESSIDAKEDAFFAQLLPRYLATREEYSKALVWYIGTLILTVVIFSLLGPRAVSLGSAETAALGNVLPLFIALVLVGVLPTVPVLQGIEPRLRRFFHERAFIPAAARATAEKMAAADFDFGLYSDPDLQEAPEMQGVERRDFERPRGTLEYTWARLSCLSYELQRCRDAGKLENLDGELLQRYGKDLDEIVERRKSFERDVTQHRRDKRRNPRLNNDQLHRAMRDVLRQLYVLLGCAIRLKLSPQADINSVLRQFGFVLEPAAPRDENHDVILVGLTVMTGSVFALAFAAVVANWLLGYLGLWQGSGLFPRELYEPFILSASALFAHGVAIWTAEFIRSRRIRQGRWFTTVGPNLRINKSNHILVAVACAIAGYVTFVLLGMMLQGITPAMLKGAAVFMILPAATGGFYAYHLDNVDLQKRPRRAWEVGYQALVTGFCGLAASTAALSIYSTTLDQAYDFVLLNTAMAAVIGTSLAWYIPEAAASYRCDPLSDAHEQRVKALESAALRRFDDAQRANDWLKQPNPALRNQTPKAAAADIEMYEHAISLLQRPTLAA